MCMRVWILCCSRGHLSGCGVLRQAFLGDRSQCLGHEISAPGWSTTGTDDPAGAASTSTAVAQPANMDDMRSLKYQAAQHGFVLHSHVLQKNSDTLKLYRIDAIADDSADLTEVSMGEDLGTQSVPTKALIHEWRLHKGAITQKLKGWDAKLFPCSPLASAAWGFEMAKGAVMMAMRDVYKTNAHLVKELTIVSNPTGVVAKNAFKVGECRLVAATARVDRKPGTNAICVGAFALTDDGEPTKLYAYHHFAPPLSAAGQPNKAPWVAPFWAAAASTEENQANMTVQYVVKEVYGFEVHVPTLVNHVALKSGDQLWWNRSDVSEPKMVNLKKRKAAAKK